MTSAPGWPPALTLWPFLSSARRKMSETRAMLDSLGSSAKIIAKIEDQAGVRNMEAIIRAAGRHHGGAGDLGIEIDYHKLPLVQTQLVQACHAEGKPVIIATHLLESMISSPMPTRAEISDVSNAIREQADAVMLSGETTTGAILWSQSRC
ncbi:MAG: pyruvate kinase [Verrucomicrobiales bacterium]